MLYLYIVERDNKYYMYEDNKIRGAISHDDLQKKFDMGLLMKIGDDIPGIVEGDIDGKDSCGRKHKM